MRLPSRSLPLASIGLFCLGLCAALCGAAPAVGGESLYNQLGAGPGVERIVDNALDLYFTDPRLRDDFSNINRSWLRPGFVIFLCHVTDGPCLYKGRSMAAAHRGLHITQARFNAVVEDLQTAMDRADIGFRTQNRLLARLAPMERDIVTR